MKERLLSFTTVALFVGLVICERTLHFRVRSLEIQLAAHKAVIDAQTEAMKRLDQANLDNFQRIVDLATLLARSSQ